ncbi:uncharacterized protein TRUGW13939_09809 [Talaromyces rugulosus]|uniref:Eisosome protein 1 n=1 Tax=Talaromyces rugulosus TaxID=121627 RepID=A0A7H8R9M3_TALRU|nr:uncharacterized protein TRUGW13939_09809 [Talaromyces rugulosus]QKX62648.1 hypothetical protein TRUGW13939_09809 [Talaromyces rugulosus]
MAAVRSNNMAGPAPKLADHAATAALYATDPERRRAADEALEAGRRRNDSAPLPAGLTLANASAAASLAHARQKSMDIWKPERQPHAEQAALLAKGYQKRPEPTPPPKINPDVYKAALLAAQDRGITGPASSTDAPNGTGTGRGARETTVVAIHPGALTAASGAVAARQRPRTESAPVKPVFNQDAAYALTAATISHQASRTPEDVLNDLDPSIEAARIHHIAKSNAQLYTSTPQVGIEVEEKKHRDTLRAAAISMAKDMYATAAAKTETDAAETAGSTAGNRQSRPLSQSQFSWVSGEEQPVTRPAPNLHEAAQKIAAEKLAKMQQNELSNQKTYYGFGPRPRPSLSRRFKRRTSSDGDVSAMDWERSEKIRNQMSSLQSRLHEVDEKKNKDRSNLMEIAQKNVNARIHDLDERVYARTGKPSPSMQREWEQKAQERAEAESSARMANFGRISVGGQKYMDEKEVEAIARARIEPTLNEIDDQVEEKRAREIENRLDRERTQRLSQLGFIGNSQPVSAEKEHKATLEQERIERKRSRKSSEGFMARTSRVFALGRKPTVKEGGEKENSKPKEVNGTALQSEDRPVTPVEQRAETPETGPSPPQDSEIAETTGLAVQPPRDDDVGAFSRSGTEPTGLAVQPPRDDDTGAFGGSGTEPTGLAVQPPRDDDAGAFSRSGTAPTGLAVQPPRDDDAGAFSRSGTAPTGLAVQPPRDDDAGAFGGSGTEPTATSQESPESPKSQSKLKSWFKSKVNRRSSKQPVAEETGGGAETQGRDNSAGFGGEDVTAGDDGSRAAPLSSNPVTEQDIAPSVQSDDQNAAIRQWSESTTGSPQDKTTDSNRRRSRLRTSIMGMISRKSPSEAGESPLPSPTTPTAAPSGNVGTTVLARPGAARLNTMERGELRDSFTEDSLPPPSHLFASPERGSVSSARDSKFSEDI